jgi:hypothetical protein
MSEARPQNERMKWFQVRVVRVFSCFERSPAASAYSRASANQPDTRGSVGLARLIKEEAAMAPGRSSISWKSFKACSSSTIASSIRLRLK